MVPGNGGSLAWSLCIAQSVIAIAGAAVTWFIGGAGAASAALFGGAVAIIPGIYFALRVFVRKRDASATDLLGAFYRAEVGKLILTALLFWIGAVRFGSHFAALMITFVACLAMNWIMLAVARDRF
ncbi:MAG: ATP synthase subunit I [Dokdonella sp.]